MSGAGEHALVESNRCWKYEPPAKKSLTANMSEWPRCYT